MEPEALAALVAAPVAGSFLGTVILRTAAGESFAAGRSRCESCRRTLTPAELIPIVSFGLQRGRCRSCKASISAFHLQIECAAVLVPASALVAGAQGAVLAAGCLLGWSLLALAWIDALSLRLPDFLTLPLLLAGLAATFWLDPEALTSSALGAALGYVLFRTLALAYRRIRRHEGLGAGDAKLLAAGGAWLGWTSIGTIVLAAALGGLLFAGALRLSGRELGATTKVPFGPFLALAIWMLWLAGSG